MTARDLETSSRTILARLRAPLSVPAPPLEAEEREQSVAELSELIRGVPEQRAVHRVRRTRQQWMVALPAAAAVLCAIGGVAWLVSSGSESATPSAAGETSGATLVAGNLRGSDGQVLAAGQRFEGVGALSTPEGQSALVLTQAGVQLTFAPASRATVPAASAEQRFVLDRGQLSLDVPPLPTGKALSVVTPDATVVVHGTRFSVTYDAAATPPTCVRVTEGRVAVNRRSGAEAVLTAGEASGCGDPEKSTDAAAKDASAMAKRPAPASMLKQQNDLFKRGLAAEQAGRLDQAEADLTRFLARYPDAPFTAEAQRSLARVRAKRQAQ